MPSSPPARLPRTVTSESACARKISQGAQAFSACRPAARLREERALLDSPCDGCPDEDCQECVGRCPRCGALALPDGCCCDLLIGEDEGCAE